MDNQTKMYSEIKEEPEIIANLEQKNESVLKALADEINARKIKNGLFTGRGTSDHACIFAQYALGYKAGFTAALGCPSLLTVYDSMPDLKDYLTIGISQSGKAEDVRSYIKRANECGGVSASITNYEDSPLAKEAKYHLFLNCGEEKSVAATKTFTAQMTIAALLTAYITKDNEISDAIKKLPDILDNVFKTCDEKIDIVASQFKDSTEGFVLSRGLTYPLALETRLKMQETCYMKVQGYAASDFYHGPLAQIDQDSKVIIYSGMGRAEKDNIDITKKIVSIGANPLFVTNNEAMASEFKNSFVLPKTGNEIVDSIVFSMFAQRLAESICKQKGMNPDQPRNLNKVTITV